MANKSTLGTVSWKDVYSAFIKSLIATVGILATHAISIQQLPTGGEIKTALWGVVGGTILFILRSLGLNSVGQVLTKETAPKAVAKKTEIATKLADDIDKPELINYTRQS